MTALSVLFHVAVMVLIFFVPDSLPGGRIDGVVYEVSLVEMSSPGSQGKGEEVKPAVDDSAVKAILKKTDQAKRIEVEKVEKEEKEPLVIAKRTVEKTDVTVKKPDLSPSQLIDKAISKIERKVKSEDSSHLDSALSKIEKEMENSSGTGPAGGGGGGGSSSGITIRIYQMEIENRIKSNWSYPVAAGNKNDLEALVIVKVNSDGTIINSWFKTPSSDGIFDQSVMKAIERSNPLPPFPEGYRRSYDEIEINFNLKDLQG